MLLLCMLRAGLEGWAVCRLVGEVAGPQTPTEACTWVCGTALAVCKIQGAGLCMLVSDRRVSRSETKACP